MRFFKKIWRPLFAILFLFILIKKGPFKVEQLQVALSQPKNILIGLVCFFLQFVLFAYRWKSFVDQVSVIKMKLAFRLTLIGQFFAFFIPGGVGGDVVKAIELSRYHVSSKSVALSTVFADRVFGLYAMIIMSTIFLSTEYLISQPQTIIPYLTLSWLLLAGLTIGIFFSPWISKKLNYFVLQKNSKYLHKANSLIQHFASSFNSFKNVSFFTKNILLCFVIQLISIIFLYIVVKSLNVEPPPFFIFFSLCCFGFLASAIPLSPAGIGVGQTSFYIMFSNFSPAIGEASVTAISVLQLFLLFFSLFGGLFFSINAYSKEKTV